MNQHQKLLNTAQTAEVIGTTSHMLRCARSTGQLYKGIPGPRYCKMGRAIRYRRQDLETWLEQYASLSRRTTKEAV